MNVIGLTGVSVDARARTSRALVREHGFLEIALSDEAKRVTQRIYDFSIIQLWGSAARRHAPDVRYPREHGPFAVPDHAGTSHCECCGGAAELDTMLKTWYVLDRGACYLTPHFALRQLVEFGHTCCPDTWVNIVLHTSEHVLGGEAVHDPYMGVTRVGHPHLRAPKGIVIPDVTADHEIAAIRAVGGHVWHVRQSEEGAVSVTILWGQDVAAVAQPSWTIQEALQIQETPCKHCV